jgi:ribose transport system permease protein
VGIILGAVVCGAICGFFNGYVIIRFHLNDFITTLASGFVFSGLALATIFHDDAGRVASVALKHKAFLSIGQNVGGFYYISIAWLIFTVIAYLVQTRTSFGLHVTAMGSNPRSSEMSGIDIVKLKIITFTLSGLFCGLAAVFIVANQGTIYLSLGDGKGFEAVAACVIGGVVLGGGKGDALGAFLGAIFMTLVSNGMYKYGLGTAWQFVFVGAVILVAMKTCAMKTYCMTFPSRPTAARSSA